MTTGQMFVVLIGVLFFIAGWVYGDWMLLSLGAGCGFLLAPAVLKKHKTDKPPEPGPWY